MQQGVASFKSGHPGIAAALDLIFRSLLSALPSLTSTRNMTFD